jgi:high-affinity nickel permease
MRASRTALTRTEWARLAGMGGFVLLLHLLGWVTLLAVVAPAHYRVGSAAFGAGMGVTAYTLGMRHAFDADHIAAIDNTTRKLMADGQRPLSTGFWFSLGHSSVVFGLCLLLSFGVRELAGQVENGSSRAGPGGCSPLLCVMVPSSFAASRLRGPLTWWAAPAAAQAPRSHPRAGWRA